MRTVMGKCRRRNGGEMVKTKEKGWGRAGREGERAKRKGEEG